jgi:phosphate transport system substrate-binding protein
MNKTLTLGVVALAVSALAGGALADTVKISGASTVFNVVVSSAKAAVEKSTGHTVQVASSSTGKGLADLAGGANEIAMVSEPMEIAADAAAAAGAKIDIKTLQAFELRKDEIVFVVHPANPVAKLSWEQIRDIHTGKIANWKEVGGKDQAIVVYADSTTGGTRAMIKKVVLGGAEFGPASKAQSSVKRAAEMVAGDEAGIAGVGKGFAESGKQKIVDSKKLERPLLLVTLGAPKPAAKAVIEAFAREAKSL